MQGDPDGEGRLDRRGILTLILYIGAAAMTLLALSLVLPV